MWSAGCILAELLRRRPLFPGRNELDQLLRIVDVCGSIEPDDWPEAAQLPKWGEVRPKSTPSKLLSLFTDHTGDTVELVEGLLQLNPSKRISAKEALDMDWFWSVPLPAKPSELPRYTSSHEYTTKKRKSSAAVPQSSAASASASASAKQRVVGDAATRKK
eukprot:TRINITY_DN6035_c0_g1_i1.p1 TRINITY_DN6035_c0_g1~~TRINITY_DN6035_c0_g1_i1.p1  ORF type:complete len:161 (+),score=74.58 TRINITY_DN6035_c0_g1_i1:302-784(+)